MTGDTNPTTPAAVEWTSAEREAVREVAWRFFFGTPEVRRDAILAALAPFVAERERQAAARALREAADLLEPLSGAALPTQPHRAQVAQFVRDRADRIERGEPGPRRVVVDVYDLGGAR